MPELPEPVFAEPEAGVQQSGQSDQPGDVKERDLGSDREVVQLRRTLGYRPQQADLPLVNTIGEALALVTDIFERQITTAVDTPTVLRV